MVAGLIPCRDGDACLFFGLRGSPMTHAIAKSPPLPPRGLNIRQASAYWGVSPGTFKKMVRIGLAPPPLNLPGLDRNIWDRRLLDDGRDARRVGVAVKTVLASLASRCGVTPWPFPH